MNDWTVRISARISHKEISVTKTVTDPVTTVEGQYRSILCYSCTLPFWCNNSFIGQMKAARLSSHKCDVCIPKSLSLE